MRRVHDKKKERVWAVLLLLGGKAKRHSRHEGIPQEGLLTKEWLF